MAARGGLTARARRGGGAQRDPPGAALPLTHLLRVVRAGDGEARFTLEALLTGLASDGLAAATLVEIDATLRAAGLDVEPPLHRCTLEDVIALSLEPPAQTPSPWPPAQAPSVRATASAAGADGLRSRRRRSRRPPAVAEWAPTDDDPERASRGQPADATQGAGAQQAPTDARGAAADVGPNAAGDRPAGAATGAAETLRASPALVGAALVPAIPLTALRGATGLALGLAAAALALALLAWRPVGDGLRERLPSVLRSDLAAGLLLAAALAITGAILVPKTPARRAGTSTRSASAQAAAARAGARQALQAGRLTQADALLAAAARSDPTLPGLALDRARLAQAERRLAAAQSSYAAAQRALAQRHYATAIAQLRRAGSYRDARAEIGVVSARARDAELAKGLRALATRPREALRRARLAARYGASARTRWMRDAALAAIRREREAARARPSGGSGAVATATTGVAGATPASASGVNPMPAAAARPLTRAAGGATGPPRGTATRRRVGRSTSAGPRAQRPKRTSTPSGSASHTPATTAPAQPATPPPPAPSRVKTTRSGASGG